MFSGAVVLKELLPAGVEKRERCLCAAAGGYGITADAQTAHRAISLLSRNPQQTRVPPLYPTSK